MKIVPTPEQKRILDLGLTSIRVRAGAGTGKTTTVALVISNLIDRHGVEPERILGLTFTNKAAAELATRVRELLPASVDESRQVEIHTYHGFAANVLSEFGVLTGIDTRSGVITPTFARQVMRDVFLGHNYRRLDVTLPHTVDQLRRLNDQMGDHLLRPADVLKAGDINEGDEIWEARLEMASVLARYGEAKARLRVADYSDLVTLSTRILEEHPALAGSVRERYRALVLDEYQDTNPAQRILIQTIFGDGFPVIAVGDEDQTIYEWRGASTENFEHFPTHFPTADGSPAHDESLTLNRRSGRAILDVANEVRRRANPGADDLEPADEIETEVLTHWASDALAEAEWIARQFEALHDRGSRWSDMAVLFRKNKDFPIVVDALSRHDIPLEVANVGGLLSVPEISFLRAWLTVLHTPEDSAALAQILFGSTYRIGLADMAALSRWLIARQADEARQEDAEDVRPVTLLEALDHLDTIDGLGDESRARLADFNVVYRDLLLETQGVSLAETCRMVLDRTRSWQDIESLPPNARLTARLNIYRFLDLADDWSPLAGRPSIAAFLDYLETMESEPAEELDAARLSGEDAVTLVTVHRAKGLEWDTVAIPAAVRNNFPSKSGAFPDPYRFPYQLPPELRLDSTIADLPEDEDGRKAFFRAGHARQEWRVAYVAVTRAKRRLLVSGAYWYGLPEVLKTASEPSELFEIVEQGTGSDGDGRAGPGPRPELLARPFDDHAPDPLFPAGWQSGLHMAIDSPEELDALADEAGVAKEYRSTIAEMEERLFSLETVEGPEPEPVAPTVSVTGLVTYAQCPLRYFWTDVDPLPRRRNPAAVRGTEIHRQIELHQRGQVPFEDLEPGLYDGIDEEDGGRPGGFSVYEQSRFADSKAALVEAPFSFGLGDTMTIRGRIDAVYDHDGRWEVVDFKTGRHKDDPSRMVQLEAYAVAVTDVDLGLSGPPTALDMTFAYLGGGLDVVTVTADERWVGEARSHLERLADGIEAGEYEPTPGAWCANCDFLRFCEAGRSEVGE